jgi:hypothetical protein
MELIVSESTHWKRAKPTDVTVILGTYNVQVHVEPTAELPSTWKEESGPSLIAGGGEHVRLATLSTDGRKIEPYISYRMENPF